MQEEQDSKLAILNIVIEVDIESMSSFIDAWDNQYTQYLVEYASIKSAVLKIPEAEIQLRTY